MLSPKLDVQLINLQQRQFVGHGFAPPTLLRVFSRGKSRDGQQRPSYGDGDLNQ
jgi:hypothetical protein